MKVDKAGKDALCKRDPKNLDPHQCCRPYGIVELTKSDFKKTVGKCTAPNQVVADRGSANIVELKEASAEERLAKC